MIKWLEISADFRCNNRCVGCFSVIDDGQRMTTGEVFRTLRDGRSAGARWLWLGGGEPTLRKDLFAIAAEARKLGFQRIKLQTNGMLLSYPEFMQRCVDWGSPRSTSRSREAPPRSTIASRGRRDASSS